MSTPILEVDRLTVRYGAIEAVRNISFHLNKGEIVALIGPNGAGKSSSVNAIVGLVPSTGNVKLDGRSISKEPTDHLIGLGITLVPEGRRVFPLLTVQENLTAGGVSRSSAERHRAFAGVLDLFPSLRSRLHQTAVTLSGGEQQMLAIGRALMGSPKVLLLDEPSLGLAPQIIDEVFDLIQRLRGDGLSILLVEQNAQRAIAISNRTLVMSNGILRKDSASASVTNISFSDLLNPVPVP